MAARGREILQRSFMIRPLLTFMFSLKLTVEFQHHFSLEYTYFSFAFHCFDHISAFLNSTGRPLIVNSSLF